MFRDALLRLPCRLALALAVAGLAPAALALQTGRSPQGVEYMSGGIGEGEVQAMRGARERFSLWLTAAGLRGAFIGSVRVRIVDLASGAAVLEHTTDGPLLYAALPPGRYEVEAALFDVDSGRLEIQRGSTTLRAGDHHQMVLRFAVPEDGDRP